MAEVNINGKKYEVDIGADGQYLSPPVLIDKPTAISIDPMDILKKISDAEFSEMTTLINANPLVAGFFTRPTISLDATTATRMQAMIDSAGLSDSTTATLTGLINELKSQVAS